VVPALKRGGYTVESQVDTGARLGRGRHVVDLVALAKTGEAYLVSLKWQQTSGTAEQKVPFEAICLQLRGFYTEGGLRGHLRYGDLVDIVTLERFVALANQGRLEAHPH